MASVTINTSAGDGQAVSYRDVTNQQAANWSGAMSGTNLAVLPTATTARVNVDVGPAFNYDSYVYRVPLPFSLSTLPSGATVTGAVLRVYLSAKTVYDGSLHVMKSTQASITALTTSDWAALANATDYCDSPPTLSSLTTSAYVDLTLNAAAIADMTSGGEFKCVLRHSRDVNNSAPPAQGFGGGYNTSSLTFNTSENASNKPELVITYTPPPTGGSFPRRRTSGLYTR